MDAWHDFYLHTNCSKRRKFAHSRETAQENQICSEQEFVQSKNLLKNFAHSRNLLKEFARSIGKLLTMKNLAGSDGSTRWLNVSHQANRSTVGARHSTVSVETAGTSWAGPSCFPLFSKYCTWNSSCYSVWHAILGVFDALIGVWAMSLKQNQISKLS